MLLNLFIKFNKCWKVSEEVKSKQPFYRAFGRQIMADNIHILQTYPEAIYLFNSNHGCQDRAAGSRNFNAPSTGGRVITNIPSEVEGPSRTTSNSVAARRTGIKKLKDIRKLGDLESGDWEIGRLENGFCP